MVYHTYIVMYISIYRHLWLVIIMTQGHAHADVTALTPLYTLTLHTFHYRQSDSVNSCDYTSTC